MYILLGHTLCYFELTYFGCSGYPIEQLAEQSSFLETSYLLLYGSLPSGPQLNTFQTEVLHHGVMHADATGFFRSFRYVFGQYFAQIWKVGYGVDDFIDMTHTPWPS
jgi:citrate synthase